MSVSLPEVSAFSHVRKGSDKTQMSSAQNNLYATVV